MRKIFIAVALIVAYAWSIPKPMESIKNYNVMIVHGAYGSEKGIEENGNLKEADSTSSFLGGATLGSYTPQFIRQHPDLYRQLASRYILVGHSMGGVVSREYVQGDFYNGDVDKIITLDSPHEGTDALNMLIKKSMREETFSPLTLDNMYKAFPTALIVATAVFYAKGSALAY